jgi:DNA segregation ATPase FtsK/SpoIIIE-like protein
VKKDVFVVACLASAAFVAACLATYHPSDPSFNSMATTTREIRNACGYVGSFLADLLFQFWGVAAWVIPAALLGKGALAWKGDGVELWTWRSTWALTFIVISSSLLALHLPEARFGQGQMALGGVIGMGISEVLRSALNTAGVAILLWGLLLVCLVFVTQMTLKEMTQLAQRRAAGLGGAIGGTVGTVGSTLGGTLAGSLNPAPVGRSLWASFVESFNRREPSRERRADSQATRTGSLSASQASRDELGRRADSSASRDERGDGPTGLGPSFLKLFGHTAGSGVSGASGASATTAAVAAGTSSHSVNASSPSIGAQASSSAAASDSPLGSAAAGLAPASGAPGSSSVAIATPTGSVERRPVRVKAKVERRIENWKLPDLQLLEDPPATRVRVDEREIRTKSQLLTEKLLQFGVRGEVVAARPGPAVTMYEFKPNVDVKISKITELADDLRLALSSESVRIIAPIPGRDVVGIETSNTQRETVYLKDIIAHDDFWTEGMKLPMALGRQANGDPKIVDLRRMPHLMVAGTTGSGKSVFVVSAITGLTFRHSPKTLRLILVDPKQVDLAAFSEIPHLLMPPIREAKKAVLALKWAVREMDKRYRSMSKFAARNLEDFNKAVGALTREQVDEHDAINTEWENDSRKLEQYYFSPQPYIVIVVEEFGDLMAVDKQNVEGLVVRLAQMARACGIHLVLAMQSPRKDVVTGLIKTNIPGRISFKVASKMDSRIILDDSGAESLLAQGDMLFLAPGIGLPARHHGPWVSDREIQAVMKAWSDQGQPQFDPLAMKALEGTGGGYGDLGDGAGDGAAGLGLDGDDDGHDEMYDMILSFVASQKEVSASLLQRRFKLGYPRASRLIEQFEREGVVGPANGSKPRAVLISPLAAEERV